MRFLWLECVYLMNWYDNMTDNEALMQAIDFNDRLDCELSDVLGEELEEEMHREGLTI